MSTSTIDILLLIGRILYGGFFLIGGVNHLTKITSYKQYSASKGVPAPAVAVGVSGLLILLGGLSVLLGFWPYIGLLLIAIFLVGVTPKMHAFWSVSDPMAKMGEQVNFMKKRRAARCCTRDGGNPAAVADESRAVIFQHTGGT